MGIKKNSAGLVVQFYDDRGNPDGAAFYGGSVGLFGLPRPSQLQGEEAAEPGSDDWLTLVAVADTNDGMDKILQEWNGDTNPSNTSAASRRVTVMRHRQGQDRPDIFLNRITIANGKIDKQAKTMDVILVKVMGTGTQMKGDHPLLDEFRAMGPFFL